MADKCYRHLIVGIGMLVGLTVGLRETSDPPPPPGPEAQCGIRNSVPSGGLVENDQEVEFPHGLPWMAYLMREVGGVEDNTYWSGAVLINESFVVTQSETLTHINHEIRDMFVVLGAHKPHFATNENIQKIKIEAVFKHPDSYLSYGSGITLARLSHPVNLTDHVRPICLPDADDSLPPGTTCEIAGWWQDNSLCLRPVCEGSVTTITNERCRYEVESFDSGSDSWLHAITKDTICTAAAEALPPFLGETGGLPLLCANKDNVYFLYGVNFQIPHETHPALFHNVPEYVPWINSVMSGSVPPSSGSMSLVPRFIVPTLLSLSLTLTLTSHGVLT